MAYQEVTKTTYGGRLNNALSGVGFGFLLIIASTVLLFWNEGRTVKTTRMLREAGKVCVELGDISAVNPEMNGKMVHASGFATTDDILSDPQFGLSLNAIQLRRSVEYYQWTEIQHSETRDKVGGGQETITTYTYEKDWVSSPQNSSSFRDPEYKNIPNDVLLTVQDNKWSARNVTFGAYKLPEGLFSQMSSSEPETLTLDPETVNGLSAQLSKSKDAGNVAYVHQDGNVIYLGSDPNNPSVGDVRISYDNVLPADVSILAVVNGNTFGRFTAKNGYSLMSLDNGIRSMDEMFQGEHKSNKTMAWIIRLVGLLLVFFGFRNIFDLLTALFKVLPFLGNIVGMGVGLVCGVLALVWTLVVIAIGWIAYRPVLGVILLLAAGALIWFLVRKGKQKKALAEV